MLILTQEERRALIRVIEVLFVNEEELHKIIMDAHLEHRFLPETRFIDSHHATKDLIDILEYYGPLPECPDYHSLGALLYSLLKMYPLFHSEAYFFAWLILRYSLVHDAGEVDRLRAHYDFPGSMPEESAPLIAALPSYPPRSPFIQSGNFVRSYVFAPDGLPLAKGETWHKPVPMEPFPEKNKQIALKNRLVSRLSQLNYSDWQKLSLETLNALIVLLDKADTSK